MRLPIATRFVILTLSLQLLCIGTAEAKAKKTVHKGSTHSTAHGTQSRSTRKSTAKGRKTLAKARSHGQTTPDSDRTREIQMALIREHYLNGVPSGSWDSQTREALTRFQADHGWQTKIVPDSRALIKLGLGPSREGLLNPDTAVLSPHELGAERPQPGGSASN